MKQGILVPFDGSENAKEALKEAAALSQALGEQLILLNVQPTYHTLHVKMFFSEETIHSFQQQQGREVLESAEELLRRRGVPFEAKIRAGNPIDEICAEAGGGNDGCDGTGVRYIVMGFRGMNSIFGGILGSVSYGVLHHAPCPVHLVPPVCTTAEAEPRNVEAV